MKDMGEANVILSIRIKGVNKGIDITQTLIKFSKRKINYSDCSPVSTLMDLSVSLIPDNNKAIPKLKYSQVIGF